MARRDQLRQHRGGLRALLMFFFVFQPWRRVVNTKCRVFVGNNLCFRFAAAGERRFGELASCCSSQVSCFFPPF